MLVVRLEASLGLAAHSAGLWGSLLSHKQVLEASQLTEASEEVAVWSQTCAKVGDPLCLKIRTHTLGSAEL